MGYLQAFFILYFLTGAIFIAYDFKLFQRIVFYIRAFFTPGGTMLNPKLYEMQIQSFPLPEEAPMYVVRHNYSFVLLFMFIWPLTPHIVAPWFFLRKQPGTGFFFNLYVIPILTFIALYSIAMYGLFVYTEIWQTVLVSIVFSAAVWLLCSRRDRKIEEWREKQSNRNSN